jgi:hypothetical protein
MIRKGKGKRRDQEFTVVPFKGMPPATYGPPTRPHFPKVPPPPNITTLGTKPLTHGSLRAIQHPSFGRYLAPFVAGRPIQFIHLARFY